MQPSSADTPSKSGSPMRRYGPLIAIVAVIAVVAGILIFASGDDDDDSAAATTAAVGAGTTAAAGAGTTAAGGTTQPEGAISFTQAQEQGLDVTFQEGCDLETGRVAIPNYFAPECYANVEDNGGATAPGVTADTITVVVYVAPDTDPVLDFITAAINNDDTAAQVQASYEGYTEIFQRYFQTYGRTVELKFLNGSGTSENGVAARADAVKAVEELGAFAVWGGPVLAPAWTEEIKARGVVCLGCPAVADPEPVVFPVTASGDQTRLQLAEYITKKLKGGNAQFAGDPALTTQPRVFGQVFIETVGGPQAQEAAEFKALLSEGGVELAEQISYALDPATLQEQAAGVIQRFKVAGVTTIIVNADPIAPKIFTEEATKQNYFPEWIFGGSALVDTNAFGRTYDQQQWAHAFGISSLPARLSPALAEQTNLYTWYFGTLCPADESCGVLVPQPQLFFGGLQAAGPNLTAETFRDGLFGGDVPPPAVTQPAVTFGDHGLWPEAPDYYGIDDFTEIWWDPTATGADEIRREGTGMLRQVDGGKRYRLGEWTSDLNVFEVEGSIVVFEELPPNETPVEYPPPNGG